MTTENANNIDWQLVAEAIENYTRLGFIYVDTPWMVEAEVADITCPDRMYHDVVVNGGKSLVASAEQGFLQLKKDRKLTATNYVSAGPCFRIMDARENPDEYHQETFFKVELFCICDTESQAHFAARELATRARNFMTLDAEFVYTDEGIDLELNGVEIGSYGARYHKDIGWWAYGTGLALPRLFHAKDTPEPTHY